MTTPPTFSSGSILTAAQMNAVGLWLVKSQTIGTGVSSVTVTGAFSADYDAYKIIVSGGVSSQTVTNIALKLGASTTGYYSNTYYTAVTSTTVSNAGTNNGSSWIYGGLAGTTAIEVSLDLINPYLAKYTILQNGIYCDPSALGYGTTNGSHNVATSYTDFTLTPGAGTLTGGTIRVYGYRN